MLRKHLFLVYFFLFVSCVFVPEYSEPEFTNWENLKSSVVRVMVREGENYRFSGTGFVIKGGWIITAKHVIDGYDMLLVKYNKNSTSSVSSTWRHSSEDLAALKVRDIPNNITPLEISKEEKYSGSVYTSGFVPGRFLSQTGEAFNRDRGFYFSFLSDKSILELDLFINDGMSGSPIIRSDTDRVIGVVIGHTSFPDREPYAIYSSLLCESNSFCKKDEYSSTLFNRAK